MRESIGALTVTGLCRFKPYPAYKDSGVDWLGEIPAGWNLKRLKRVVDFQGGGTPAKENVEYWRGEIPWVSPKDMKVSVVVNTEDKITPEAIRESATKLVPVGAVLLVVRSGILVHSIPVALAGCEVTLNQDLKAMIPNSELVPEYLMYLITGMQRELLVEWKKEGATVESLELELVANTSTPLPSVSEQHAIAAFLDRETAKIDALVAKKERLIELLKEKRAALITRAVTKGLEPNVPIEDSGIEWLGEIPAHWEAKRVKWAAKMESGHTPDKKVEAYWTDGDVPWVSLNDSGYLRDHDYIGDTAYYTNALGLANSSARLLPAQSVVFSRDATVGLSAITSRPMAVSQHFIAWICGIELMPEYLLYVFRAMTQELDRLTMGATIKTIGMPDVRSLNTPLPPREEQELIVSYIHEQSETLDKLIAKIREGIEKLKEYRTALISAAVTGKIDVREGIGIANQRD